MSKKEFVDAYAKATGETKKRSEELVNQFLETVEKTLLNGDSVQFVGWGTFEVKERAARTGINPQTKKEIKIPAKKVVKFKVGKKLADSVAEGK
ncbi:histone family protein DNA-binding protein [Leptotrichia hofstadii]|uniref:Histone family protein DNA-binding protein n=1 Tax=Leptotrichia hofstadii TaxID=157688 RepID=A0A510JLE1_9FUSO|nr:MULTISPECIES: HU family DNA-binding protein [Leptotrichia]BBM39125.1 histone family protein DNA-binding protein [Leptotrichia hofstadii]